MRDLMDGRAQRTGTARPASGAMEQAASIARLVAECSTGESAIKSEILPLIDIAVLVATRAATELLSRHVEAALTVGAGRDEIIDAIVEAALYAGVTAGEVGLRVARGVFARMDATGLAA